MSDETQLVDVRGETLTAEEPPEIDWTETEFPIELFEDRIAIKRADREQITEGGIHLPPDARTRSMTGLVVAAGPGITKGDGSTVPMKVAVGETVVFEQFRAMIEIKVNGHTYHIVKASDLLGKSVGDVKIR
jgi:chaperonin GroES